MPPPTRSATRSQSTTLRGPYVLLDVPHECGTMCIIMTPAGDKTTTLNFRVEAEVPEMLRQLAESAGLSMTEYVVKLIRAMHREEFPDRAREYETAAEKLDRQLLGRRQDRYRAELDAAFEGSEAPGTPVHVALRRAARVRADFDNAVGSGRTIAVDAEWSALKAFRHFEQEASRKTEEAAARALQA